MTKISNKNQSNLFNFLLNRNIQKDKNAFNVTLNSAFWTVKRVYQP